jgi:serine protease AprX
MRPKHITQILTAVGLAGVLAIAAPAYADSSAKCDNFIKNKMRKAMAGKTQVIIALDGSFTSDKKNQLKKLGVEVGRELSLVKSVTVRLPNALLSKLADLPWVRHMSEDVTMNKSDEFTVKSSLADVAWSQFSGRGEGIAVAVLDSGIKQRPDLLMADNGSSRVIANVSVVPNDPSTDDPCGHGTHVAGIIAGNGSSSTGSNYYRTFYGIATNVNLVNVRVLDANGQANVSTVIQGITWVIDHKNDHNIGVINLSLGHAVGESYTTDPLCQAVERAWKAGIVVVTAAGNSGRKNATAASNMDNDGYGTAWGSIECPANDPYVITVGAMKQTTGVRSNDAIASYSSRGPSRLDFVMKPDIVAPGNRIISLRCPNSMVDNLYGSSNTVQFNEYKLTSSTADTPQYFRLSGTSMAAPVVAAAAALMLQKDPALTPDTIKARLMLTADKLKDKDGNTDPLTYGAGYLNVAAALGSTVVSQQSTLSPAVYRDDVGNVIVNASQIIWGMGLWGIAEIPDAQIVWGTLLLIGEPEPVLPISQIIWGTGVWTDTVIWGTNTQADVNMTTIFGED